MSESIIERCAKAMIARRGLDPDMLVNWERFHDDVRTVIKEVSAFIREQELAGVPACDVIDTIDHILNESAQSAEP